MSDDPRFPEQPPASGYPTERVPDAPTPEPPGGSTGQLPVTGAPLGPASAAAPRGPYVPTVVRGLVILAMVAVVFVWRLVDDPDWAVVGITVGVAAGALLLLAAVASLVIHRARRERDFERMLSGS